MNRVCDSFQRMRNTLELSCAKLRLVEKKLPNYAEAVYFS